MLLSRDGIPVPRFASLLRVLGLFVLVVSPLAPAAQGPSARRGADASIGSAGDRPVSLRFADTDLGRSPAGYASLSWNQVPGTAVYQITDAADHVLYSGTLPEFFISGLADGTYQFGLSALDPSGNVIARSEAPATLTVSHWPLGYALLAFVIGLVVMFFVIGMIVVGSRSQRAQGGTGAAHHAEVIS